MEKNKIIIDGEVYLKVSTTDLSDYCVVRTYSAGVFVGKIKERKDKEVFLTDSFMIYKWVGAASLSQLAMEGVKDPDQCKFTMTVPERILTEVIEIIPCSIEGIKNLMSVKRWKMT